MNNICIHSPGYSTIVKKCDANCGKGTEIKSKSIVKNVILEPSRGNIYASDGNILATSIPRYELHWDSVTTDDYLFETEKKSQSTFTCTSKCGH